MTENVLKRLESGGLETLTSIAIDHLLSVPIASLVNAKTLASQVVIHWRHLAASEQAQERLVEHIDRLRAHQPEGSLRDRIPANVVTPLREAVVRPMVPNRAIVGRLLEHGAVEELLRELLVGALHDFAKRLRPSMPGTDRAVGKLRGLKRVSEGMLGGLGAELERQAEQKAKDFVDTILSSVVAQAADEICNPAKAEDFGRFRSHLLDQILDTPLSEVKGELDRIDTQDLVETASQISAALAMSDSIEDQVVDIIELALESIGDLSAGQLLADAGLSDSWRAEAERQVTSISRAFIETEPFKAWLRDILAD